MSELLPTNWSQVPISSLGETFNGLTGKTGDDFSEGEPFVTYLQVFNGRTHDKSLCGKVRINGSEKQNRVQYGDLLFTTSSETAEEVGYATAFLTREFQPFLNSFCFGFRLNNWESFDPHFAKHYVSGNKFRRQMIRLAQGSTRYNLSKTEFLKTTLSLPPLKEQQKIAEILNSVDEVIENTQCQINKLENLKKATMNELLTKGIGHTEFKETEIGRIPSNWDLKKLADLCEVTSSKRVLESDYRDHGVRFYRSKEIIDKVEGRVSGKPIFISNEFFNELDAKHGSPKTGDILVTAVGTIGVIYQVNHEQFYFKDGNLLWLRSIRGVSSNYLCVLLRAKSVQDQIKTISAGSSQSALTIEKLKDITIPIPSLDEQAEIYNISVSVDKLLVNTYEKHRKLQESRSSLMQDLLTGKVRVMVN
jgi:type I restriction enzyme, S subunit